MPDKKYSTYSFLLDRTAKRVKQFAQKRFKELGFEITVDQWLIIKNLYEKEGLNQSELAELTFKDHPTLTRIIDILCKKGLTERKMHPKDRRSFVILLTPEGKAKVEELMPSVNQIRTQAWNNLTEQDFTHLKHVLNTIYENLSL